ncbi:MAG: SDR family NAD(P)-dependent oxidoreductase [Henriciella sp.]|uniref:SDR family NAD(P)-dependent oxidoreductase n=1 Tax=Henriciella sp. TaxID=1968823 RepID=UPI003C76AB13
MPVGRVTPGLREARLIEFIGPSKDLNFHFVQALAEAGFIVREVDQPSGMADALILAHGLGGDTLASHAGAVTSLAAMARHFEQKGGPLVLLQNSGGRFQPEDDRAWLSGLTGLSRTAQKEFPDAVVRTIDVDVEAFGPRPAADRVLEELLTGGAAPCVGLSASGRLVPLETDHHWSPKGTIRPGPDETFLVTGGARGVTADCIIKLAEETRANFVLLGRSEAADWPGDLPFERDEKRLRGLLVQRARASGGAVTPAQINSQARALLAGAEIRETLAHIETAGARAIYLAADVGNAHQLAGAIATAKTTFGEINGLVHGAGVLADKLIREKTAEQVARVFSPKVLGLQSILSALDTSALKHIVFFSSVAARYGNPGQADYAMANEILNRVAHALKTGNPATCVTSIGWGPWDGGMVDDGLRAKFAEMGIELISREAGAQTFVNAVMAGPACPVELIAGSELADG